MNRTHFVTSQVKWHELEDDWKTSNPPNKRLIKWAAIQLILSIICVFFLIAKGQTHGALFLIVLAVATVVMAFGFTGRIRRAPKKFPCIVVESHNDLVVVTFDDILPLLAYHEGWDIK